MYIRNKSIPMVIILSLVTCGIYYYVWMYQTSQEINNSLGDISENSGLEILLTILTCGIYGFYWIYKYNHKILRLAGNMQKMVSDNTVVCVLLGIFGFIVVSQGIMQSQINFLAGDITQQ